MYGGLGFWLKSKSLARLPRPGAFSRTSGRGSGRPRWWGRCALVEEAVLDELEVGVLAQDLVVDVAALGIGADHEGRNAEPIALPIDHRRIDVVVEAVPIVPAEEDRGRVPGARAHDRVDQAGDRRLPVGDESRRVVAVLVPRDDPGDRREVVVGVCWSCRTVSNRGSGSRRWACPRSAAPACRTSDCPCNRAACLSGRSSSS
jgi:hypothetical protein